MQSCSDLIDFNQNKRYGIPFTFIPMFFFANSDAFTSTKICYCLVFCRKIDCLYMSWIPISINCYFERTFQYLFVVTLTVFYEGRIRYCETEQLADHVFSFNIYSWISKKRPQFHLQIFHCSTKIFVLIYTIL